MTTPLEQWFVFDVNPYPWKVPPITAGRKGKGVFPIVGRDAGLHSYKEAIKEQLTRMPHWKVEGPVILHLWFYRNVPTYKTRAGRLAKKHDADTTNLQKAAEDALQGFLFDNDRDVVLVMSHRVEQSGETTGMLVACVKPYEGNGVLFPDEVQSQIDEMKARYDFPPDDRSIESDPEDIPF